MPQTTLLCRRRPWPIDDARWLSARVFGRARLDHPGPSEGHRHGL